MSYYNEATAEMVKPTDIRANKINIKKSLSSAPLCQGGYSSSEPLTILGDNIEKRGTVHLNYIADVPTLMRHGLPINDPVLPFPHISEVDTGGLEIPVGTPIIAEELRIDATNTETSVHRDAMYSMLTQTLSVKNNGRINLVRLGDTEDYLFVDNGGLYFRDNTDKISDLPYFKRIMLSIMVANGCWRDRFNGYNAMGYVIVAIGDKIVHYHHYRGYAPEALMVATYDNELARTFTTSFWTIDANENALPEITQPSSIRPTWGDNLETYQQIIDQAGPVLSLVHKTIKEGRRDCI
jgi:hypothetical protein